MSSVTAVVRLSRVTGVSGSLKSEAEEMDTEVWSKVTALIDETGSAITGVAAVTVTAVSARTSLSVEIVETGMSSSRGFWEGLNVFLNH